MKSIHSLLLAVALILGISLPLFAQTPTVPAQASAVGFNSLTFDDEFTTNDVSGSQNATPVSGMKWYPFYWASGTTANVSNIPGTVYAVNGKLTTSAPSSPTAAQTATGVTTFTGGGNFASCTTYAAANGVKNPNVAGSFRHAYFEARIQMAGNAGGQSSENAFWSWSTSQFYNNATTSYAPVSELDFFEWPPDSQGFYGCNTMHNWVYSSSTGGNVDTCNTNAVNTMVSVVGTSTGPGTIMTDGNFHVYGCLWAPLTATTGYVETYLDNKLVVHPNGVTRILTGVGTGTSSGAVSTVNGVVCYTPPGAGLAAQEASYQYMVLGGEAGWPLNVDWVHVWQAGSSSSSSSSTATTAQTVTGFPSTLSLSTTASPYTLPATTSAGMTLTYTVASGPATVSGHILTLTGAGEVVIDASQAGNSSYAPYSGTETITVTAPGTQTLSGFPATLALLTTQSPYTLPATTSAGLSVTYSIVSGPATISGNTLTVSGAGTVVVNASQSGNSSYAAYAATETINVTQATQTVSNFPVTLSLTTGQSPYTLPAKTSANLSLTYSLRSGPATISGDTLSLTGAGTVVLTASQAGNATYAPLTAKETITVAALTPQTVSNFPSTLSLSTTQSPYTLPATTSAGLTISYSLVSGPATVSGNTLTLTGAGTVVLTASQAGNSTYASYSGEEAITVTAATQTLPGFPSTLSLTTGESPYALPATTSAGLTPTYSITSGPASVSGHTLTLTGAGTVVVSCRQAGNAVYAAYSGTETITVSSLTAQTVASFASTKTVTLGSGALSLPSTTSAGQAITYTVTSGPATISGDSVTFTGAGIVVITATAAGNSNYAAYSSTETITVNAGATLTFTQWESLYFTSAQMANSAVSGPTAMPLGDQVPNLLKYLYDINPAVPMTTSEYAAMQTTDVDTTTTPGTTYLTLTYRQYAKLTGITVQVQVSTDMQNWTTVTPNIIHEVGTDPTTGDPIIEDEVASTATTEFIRLNVTQP